MRPLLFSILAALLFAVSCEKQSGFSLEATLEGTWVVKQVWADPGDGSGTYNKVTVKPAPEITFRADGTVSSSSGFFGLHMIDSFKVIDSAQVLLSFKPQSSQPQMIYRYSFEGNVLELNPPCIEGCGLKLVRSADSSQE